MARISRPNASPQNSQSLRPLDPIIPRQTALLAIFVMLIAILFFNIASYSLGAMASRLGKMPILNANAQTRQSDELDLGGQDWLSVLWSEENLIHLYDVLFLSHSALILNYL